MAGFFANPETWVYASFLLFVALLVYLKVPAKALSALDTRSAAIARELDDARKLREEAEALLEEYRAKASNAKAEADALLAQAEKEAEAYAREARAAFEDLYQRRLQQAELKIKQEEEKARKLIAAQAAELAVAAAKQILEQKMAGPLAEQTVASGIDIIKKRLH